MVCVCIGSENDGDEDKFAWIRVYRVRCFETFRLLTAPISLQGCTLADHHHHAVDFDDADDDLYIKWDLCVYVYDTKKLYSKDFVVSPVSRHLWKSLEGCL